MCDCVVVVGGVGGLGARVFGGCAARCCLGTWWDKAQRLNNGLRREQCAIASRVRSRLQHGAALPCASPTPLGPQARERLAGYADIFSATMEDSVAVARQGEGRLTASCLSFLTPADPLP